MYISCPEFHICNLVIKDRFKWLWIRGFIFISIRSQSTYWKWPNIEAETSLHITLADSLWECFQTLASDKYLKKITMRPFSALKSICPFVLQRSGFQWSPLPQKKKLCIWSQCNDVLTVIIIQSEKLQIPWDPWSLNFILVSHFSYNQKTSCIYITKNKRSVLFWNYTFFVVIIIRST
jgi:hypothetical protein